MTSPNLRNATSILALGLFTSSASALPFLQLDALPGIYQNSTETTVATANPFTIRAMIGPNADLNRDYFVSVAVVPGSQDTGFGTFTFDGVTITSSDLYYGTPPVDASNQGHDGGDLGSHGVFPAYFGQFEFNIDPGQTISAYNVEDGSSASGFLYYMDFEVNILGLTGQPNSPYALHFDLYTTISDITNVYTGHGRNSRLIGTVTDVDVDQFAPFSHDAESGHGIVIIPPPQASVPEGGATLLMLGSALTGLGVLRRKFASRAS